MSPASFETISFFSKPYSSYLVTLQTRDVALVAILFSEASTANTIAPSTAASPCRLRQRAFQNSDRIKRASRRRSQSHLGLHMVTLGFSSHPYTTCYQSSLLPFWFHAFALIPGKTCITTSTNICVSVLLIRVPPSTKALLVSTRPLAADQSERRLSSRVDIRAAFLRQNVDCDYYCLY